MNKVFIYSLMILAAGVSVVTSAGETFKHGAVMARAMVLNEDNQPILVHYNEDGSEAGVVSIPDQYKNRVRELQIINAYEYHIQQNRLDEYLLQHAGGLAQGAEVLSRQTYLDQTYPLANGSAAITPSALPSHIKSVLIRGRSNRLVNDPSQLVLLSFTVDLSQSVNPPEVGSLVVDPDGKVIASSTLMIGPRAGFYGDPDEAQEFYSGIRKNEDQIFGPVKNVKVYISPEAYPGSVAVTDDKGKYSMRFRLPYCPGGMEFTTDVWAELRYANFSPNGAPVLPYYLRRQDWTYCYDLPPFGGTSLGAAMAYVNAMAVVATMAIPIYNIDLKVDVMFLSGRVVLKNPDGSAISVGGTTEYHVDIPDTENQAQGNYDLDGDGYIDPAVLGTITEIPQPDGSIVKSFSAGGERNIQGVYLSSRGGVSSGSPHLFRVADTQKNLGQSQGFLKSISVDDFKNTDIMVFREATGQLVLERKGLRDEEVAGRRDVGLGEENQYYYYRLMLRGPMDHAINVGAINRRGTWKEWATEYQMAEPFQEREANHLKSGEWIRIVVINRATGYVGTQRMQLKDASTNAYGMLQLPLDDIALMPPNLKVWAERTYDITGGLTANQGRNYLIGAEGASLDSDTYVQVYTEWFDHDGRPLPEELGRDNGEQYGLTGRLAKVSSSNSLTAVSQNGMANFPIAPGRNMQVLRVPDNLSAPEHFYIHVSGTQKDENPNFTAAGGAVSAPMDTRPRGSTPFQVPLSYELMDWYTIAAWNTARKAFNAGESDTKPLKPQPNYVWRYRPEYQFSQYQLEVDSIRRNTSSGDTRDLLDDPLSLIGLEDRWLEIFYSLVESNNDRLTPIDGPQDLVIAVGEYEIKATIGENQQIRFDNLEHLGALNPEDYLTLRLYSNQDAGNILWEYAFDTYGEKSFSRTHSQARFNDESAYTYNMVDSYSIFNVPVESASTLQVNLLDHNKQPVSTVISGKVVDAGMHHFVMLRSDLDSLLPRAGVDGYILVKTIPLNGNRTREKFYEINMTESINGDMLGQVIEHDTLIQRGALTLSRQDMVIQSPGPQLDFMRSYANESKPENEHDVLSPGWSHNHNLYVQVLAWSDDQPPYGNNLPGWIAQTRETLSEPKLLDPLTLHNLLNRAVSPSMVAVSNGGTFKRRINNWVNQRGNHGSITPLSNGGWEYRSKDGTVYVFDAPLPGQDKGFVKSVTDRNGNKLTYEYTTIHGQRLLLSVKDAANRQLTFAYNLADNGKIRLTQVENSAGASLEFSYYPKATSGYDARVGMLKSFKRGIFTETYDYRQIDIDPRVNLSTVTDANGGVTRYEYYDRAAVPEDMAGFARGLDENDVVHKVFYPGGDHAELKYPVSAANNKREVVDLRGNVKTYTLNVLGNPVRLDEPEGQSTTFEWSADMDEPGNALRKKSELAKNANWEYQYDARGNLTKEIDPYGKETVQSWDQHFSVLLYRQDKNGHVTEQEIDARGNVLVERQSAVVDGNQTLVETRHTYGDGGSFKGVRRTTTNGRGARTDYFYDAFGTLSSVKEAEGSVTNYTNNNRGFRLTETDAENNTTSYEYDDLDRITKVTDAEGNSTSYQYDNKGNRKVEEVRDSYLANGATYNRYLKLAYTYDARDRVTQVVRTGNLNGSSPIGGSKTYAYDGNSNLTSESDWKGAATTYTYDKLNRRITAQNRGSNTQSYAYVFNNGVITTITDVEGRVTVEHADKLGRKTKIVHPAVTNSDGSTASYQRVMTYDNLDNVVALVDENNNTTTYAYDGRNLKVRQTNAEGKHYQWQYDAAGNISKTIDEAGRVTTLVYDKQNRLVEKQMPENQKWQYTYYANGTLKTEKDPWKFNYTYSYNKIKQRVSVTHPDGTEQEAYTKDGKLTFKRDAEGRSISKLYGPENRLQQEIDSRGRVTTYTYDNNNNLTDTELSWSSATAGPGLVKYHREYDSEDRLTMLVAAQGSAVEQVTEYQYDKLGNKTRESRPEGRVTLLEYDELNRVRKIRSATVDGLNADTLQLWDGLGNKLAVTDRRGNTTTTEYDALNRPVKVTDADNKVIAYTYDEVGNLLTETSRRNVVTERIYDGLNRELERVVDDGGTRFRLVKNEYDIGGNKKHAVIDANGNRIETTLDWRGNTLATTLPAGASYSQSITSKAYDKSGFLLSSTDEAGFVTTYSYYADGTVASTTNPESETTSFDYDVFGNKARITKPKGMGQLLEYDAQNRLTQVTDALGGITRFEYDSNNNLVRQFLPAANDSGSTQVEYVYDALNRKREHIQHKAGGNLVSHYRYDAEGNLVETVDAKGQVFTSTYDALNRIRTQSFPAGSDITSIVTTYDANGNVNTITETKGSNTEITRNDYDLLDRLTRQEQRGRVITYAYDNNGNRTSVASLGGSSTYTYDSRNRLATVASGGTTTYQYYANNWLEQVSYANGTKAVYSYDQVGRVKTITNTLANGNVLSSFAYTYDSNGNRTQQVESQYGFLTVQTLTTDYVFDNLDRLESYTETGSGQNKNHRFTYYPSYDRKTETVVSDGTTLKERHYHYNETYWLTRIDEAAGTGGSITYEYDNNGNSTRKTDTTGGSTVRTLFDYNSRNQLKRVAHGAPGNEVIQGTHDYNYAGMRIRHIGSERGDIEYLYDGNSILDELQNNTTNLVAHYRYGDRLLSLTHSGSDQFYHYAALGTTANLTNEQGQNQVAYRTDAFGEITQQEGTSVNRHVFTGQEHDEKTGLIYFGARFYDPDTARFINQDTYLGEGSTPPSLHRYLYAYANPTIYLDYNGNFPITEQVSAWLHQRAADNTDALKGIQKDHGSTIGTRSLAAISGIGAGLFSAAGGIVGLIDMGLDAQAANLRYIPGAENVSVIRESAEKTDRRREAVANFAIGAKDYITQENLTDALKRDGGKAWDATGTYMGDVFVRGNLDATASWSGAMFEIAMTGATTRSAKLASQVDIAPTLTDELSNISRGANNAPPVRNSPNSQPSPMAHGCPCCFAGGTPVLTKDGLKPIEELKEGELVASRNDKTGEVEWKPVTARFVNDDDRITYALVLVDEHGHEESYEVTDNHPFNVEGIGWVDSIDLKLGMKIPSYHGGYLTVKSLTNLNRSPKTYNVEVGDFHTYFVGEQGAWVHNQCSCSVGQGSPFNGSSANRPGGYQKGDVDQHGLLSPQTNRAPGNTNTRTDNFVQSHHPVQDKWAQENIAGYDRDKAPAILLESASGKEHAKISASQRARRRDMKQQGIDPYSTTIFDEFNIGYREMIDAGVPEDVARKAIKDSYKYFDSLGGFDK